MGKGDTWIDRGRMDKSRVKEKARGIKTRKRHWRSRRKEGRKDRSREGIESDAVAGQMEVLFSLG